MIVDDSLIKGIIQRILSVAQPDRIILFGSAATGKMTSDSDIDLLVLEEFSEDTRQESAHIRSRLRGLGLPIDVFVMTSEQFEQTKYVIGGIAYPANKYGKIIYEAV
jgi:predicted nucleotidyltransferase